MSAAKALAIVLLGSLALNVYLLLFSSKTGNSTETNTTVAPQSTPTPSRFSAPTPPPSMLDSPSTAPNDVPPDVAKLDRSALEQRLVAAEAKLEKHLPYEERFDRDERSPESEARLKPFLDKVFATKPGVEPPYKFECRARLCRITPTKDAPEEWVRDIQTDPDAFALTAGASFGASRAFLQLDDPDLAAGKTFLRDVLMPLRDQKPINECKAANPAPGRLVITLVLDAVTRRLHVETSGSLASQASGLCIRKIFDDLVSKVVVPPEVKALPSWPIPFDVP